MEAVYSLGHTARAVAASAHQRQMSMTSLNLEQHKVISRGIPTSSIKKAACDFSDRENVNSEGCASWSEPLDLSIVVGGRGQRANGDLVRGVSYKVGQDLISEFHRYNALYREKIHGLSPAVDAEGISTCVNLC